MRIAISNIAWDVTEDEEVALLLNQHQIDAIDIAPGKYFRKPLDATPSDIIKVKKWWQNKGIDITGMQALLFGTTGLNIFGPPEVQAAMLKHLNAICSIAAGLGATKLVFGSPLNRDRSGFNDEETIDIAVNFFTQLAQIAKVHDVIICLEPNPVQYRANFMVNSEETANIVSKVSLPSIRMQIDTGSMALNNEPVFTLQNWSSLIGHIHLSEPHLVPLSMENSDHVALSEHLNNNFPNNIATIEMLATNNVPHLTSIKRSLEFAILYYRTGNECYAN